MGSVLPEFISQTHVITVDRVPEWVGPTDFIEHRGKKTFFVSQTKIPRWRAWLNRISRRRRRISK